jgi:protein-S-isoprenylcysteine O-methyltransferase Ste14
MSHESIQPTLARSYFSYFIFSIVGLMADTLVGFRMEQFPYASTVAYVCFGLGGLIIAWAQYTSRRSVSTDELYFFRGPYRYMRNPTHLGLVLLVAGYTTVSGSLLFFAVTMIGYLISNILFSKYEAILDRTYGEQYQTYKTKVPKIF